MIETVTSINKLETPPFARVQSSTWQSGSSNSKPSLSFAEKAQSLAEWVCSRESTYRSALDLVGWELPSLVAAATRNKYSFAEASFLSVIGFVMIWAAPNLTKFLGRVLSKFYLNADEQKDTEKLLHFQLNDLDDDATVNKAINRMNLEEPEDAKFMAELYKDKPEKSAKYQTKANDLAQFFSNLNITDDTRSRIKALKKAVILGESFIESIVWGGYYFYNRLFRKYILKQDRFTGTKGYESDKEAEKTGDKAQLKLWNKLGIIGSMLSGPLLNKYFLNKIEDKELVANSKWWQTIKTQWDMTHGVFPKLGLLFSFVQFPVSIGQMFAAQGKNELFENILRQFTMVPSWWFGHKLTNGVLAKLADKKLSNKFGTTGGVLIEPSDLHKTTPEPAKIQHILKSTSHNPELQKEARKEHAKALYAGFGLHALLVFGARMLMNAFTKWRVTKQLKTS